MSALLRKPANAPRPGVANADVFNFSRDVKKGSAKPSDMFKVTQQLSG